MQLTIFAKKRQTKEGKTFYNYLSTLISRDGRETPVQVKFRDAAGQPRPESCPCNIIVDKANANLSTREYTDSNTAEIRQSKTLWVSAWKNGPEYVDHSLDDYD